jgi:hypothetical protein
MKAKCGSALDRELLRRPRSMAVHEGKRLNQIIEEALADLLSRKSATGVSRVVARTAGCLDLSRERVDRIETALPPDLHPSR